MKLLDAVNRILPKLGEHTVTSLDAKSPTLAILLDLFEAKNKELTTVGWWFNDRVATLPRNPSNEIDVTEEVLSFVADKYECAVRAEKLYNTAEGTYVWTENVTGRMITLVPFEELPESVANWVFWTVLVEQYITDIGVTNEAKLWASEITGAGNTVLSEHLRNKRYSTQRSPRYNRYRRALCA
jgi:hypothetical protein